MATPLPYIVVVVDEMADLDLHRQKEARELLEHVLFTAAKAGILLILSTGVISGHAVPTAILSGIEERVIFRLFDREDYRKFLNTVNFSSPLAKGDFVFRVNNQIVPGKSALIAPSIIEQIVHLILQQKHPSSSYALPTLHKAPTRPLFDPDGRDPLFEDTARLIIHHQLGSSSLIQRRMKLGYNRVGRIMDQLEAAGIIGPDVGSKPRNVLIKSEEELDILLRQLSK